MRGLTEITTEIEELSRASSDQIADILDLLKELNEVIGGMK